MMFDFREIFHQGTHALSALPLAAWIVLALLAAITVVASWMAHWLFRAIGTKSQPTRQIGMSNHVQDGFARMHVDDVRELGLPDGAGVILKLSSKRFERRVRLEAFHQRRDALASSGGITLNPRDFEALKDASGAGGDDGYLDLPLSIKGVIWPHQHPDPSIRVSYWVTVWVTIATTIITIIIEVGARAL